MYLLIQLLTFSNNKSNQEEGEEEEDGIKWGSFCDIMNNILLEILLSNPNSTYSTVREDVSSFDDCELEKLKRMSVPLQQLLQLQSEESKFIEDEIDESESGESESDGSDKGLIKSRSRSKILSLISQLYSSTFQQVFFPPPYHESINLTPFSDSLFPTFTLNNDLHENKIDFDLRSVIGGGRYSSILPVIQDGSLVGKLISCPIGKMGFDQREALFNEVF